MAVTSLSKVFSSGSTANTSVSVGVIRADYVLPQLNFTSLRHAVETPSSVPNPSNSPGCTPIIRAFLVQTGLPFAVAREMANNGENEGHSDGDALDLRAVAGAINPDAQLADLAAALHAVPGMFTRICFKGTGQFTNESVRDGYESSSELYNATVHSIHVQSTLTQMSTWLNSGGSLQGEHQLADLLTDGTFGERTVFYNDKNTPGTKAPMSSAPTIGFW